MSTAHKLAKQIRDLDVQDSISLDGVSDAQVADLVDQSFATPIPAPEMIRVQFIVGGGKKCRARFALNPPPPLDDTASALRSCPRVAGTRRIYPSSSQRSCVGSGLLRIAAPRQCSNARHANQNNALQKHFDEGGVLVRQQSRLCFTHERLAVFL